MVYYINESNQVCSKEYYMLEQYITEANFKILPVFKEDPKLRKYENDIEDAIDLCKKEGEPTKAGYNKFCTSFLRMCSILNNVIDVFNIGIIALNPIMLPINICLYMWNRLCDWGVRYYREYHLKEIGKKALISINTAIRKVDNEDVKNKLIDLKNKIEAGTNEDYD